MNLLIIFKVVGQFIPPLIFKTKITVLYFFLCFIINCEDNSIF
jgi:hypothetical protein